MNSLYPTEKELGRRVHISLKVRIIFYFVVTFVMTGISISHIIDDHSDIFLALLGFFAGMGIGTLASRILTIKWDKGARKVISRMDIIGVAILVVYTALELYRTQILAYFVDVHDIVTVSFALMAGIMFGRLMGIRGKIGEIFEEQNID